MSWEEYTELKEGDRVWIFCIKFSNAGRIALNLIAELELVDEDLGRFKVLQVKSGTSLNVGSFTCCRSKYEYLFRDEKEGKEEWNRSIRNCEDKLTSNYQRSMKIIKKKLLE